jgi:hypothetical protein
MSKSLIHFVDAALLPASLMVLGKLVGLVLTVQLFNVPISLAQAGNSIFSVRPEVSLEHLVAVSTYSDIAAGFSFVLMQATMFHDTHVKPATLVKLSNYNLLGLVRSSFDLYHMAAIWMFALWLTTGLISLNAAFGRTELWVAISSICGSILFSAILLQDVYREIELARKNLGQQQALS